MKFHPSDVCLEPTALGEGCAKVLRNSWIPYAAGFLQESCWMQGWGMVSLEQQVDHKARSELVCVGGMRGFGKGVNEGGK